MSGTLQPTSIQQVRFSIDEVLYQSETSALFIAEDFWLGGVKVVLKTTYPPEFVEVKMRMDLPSKRRVDVWIGETREALKEELIHGHTAANAGVVHGLGLHFLKEDDNVVCSVPQAKELLPNWFLSFPLLNQWQSGEVAPTLDKQVQAKAPTIEEILQVMKELCQITVDIHRTGTVHGDLKPANILVIDTHFQEVPSHSRYHVQIVDFGSSAPVGKWLRMGFSKDFSAPERILKQTLPYTKNMDTASLGLLLYWLLGAEHPYQQCSFTETLSLEGYQEKLKALEEPTLLQVAQEVPEGLAKELQQLASELVSLEPDDRPPLGEVILDLQRLQDLYFPDEEPELLGLPKSTTIAKNGASSKSDLLSLLVLLVSVFALVIVVLLGVILYQNVQ